MTNAHKLTLSLIAALLSLLPIDSFSPAQSARPDALAVIVNQETPINELTLAEVRKLFLGERQYWNAKLPAVLLMPAPAAPEREVILRVVYQMSEAQFRQYWVAKIYRAEVTASPKIVYSEDLQYQLVSAVPGAIALVDARNVRPGVKLVRVDGLMPGNKNYPLR
ncbi:MAG TPA: hypothetical protein VJN93_13280 [Candidatus Acidoferrum sp.]|nr:hypothetical protein [Candidatus Acidoferrum sp.]